MTTYYFWDEIEDNVVREYDENNNTIANYTTEPTPYGSVLSQDRSGEKRYFQFDGLGNTTELTNASGNVTDTRRYSAFGETTASSGATSTPLGFGGRWGYHSSGGAPVSIRRRQYELEAPRWMSPRPLSTTLSILYSPFVFSDNSPAIANDPSGLFSNRVPNSPQENETSKHTAHFVFDSEGGIDGSLEWHQCKPNAKACISPLLDTIVEVLESDDARRCFRDSYDYDNAYGQNNMAFRRDCRSRIGPCILDSIRYVHFRCVDKFTDPKHNAEARGMCVRNKKLEFVDRPIKETWLARGCHVDKTCNACPPDHLAMTYIYLRDAQFSDPDRCVTEPNIKSLIHELSHLCTGGHEGIMSKHDRRVDAARLANDFFQNCGHVVTSQGRPRR